MNRPVIRLIPSRLARLLDGLSFAGLIFIWIFCIVQYTKLPEVIPIHFTSSGDADNHGSKSTLFLLPVIITFVFVLLTILNRYPHIFNYPQSITEANAKAMYTSATTLLRIIKLIIVVFTMLIMIEMIRSARAGHSQLTWWFIPAFVLSLLIPVVISIYTSFKKK